MLRHEFRPGKLIAGLFLTAAGVMYLGDASDAWQTPWFAVIPLVIGGLCLAGAVGVLNLAIRGRGASERKGPPAPPGFESGAAGSAGTTKDAGTPGSAGVAGTATGADPGGATGPSGSAR